MSLKLNILRMKDDTPLISVIILTYNSSSTVLETLDSVFVQSYKRIELIISDDSSKDSTVELCNNWISLNRSRFESCKVVTSATNTGVTLNVNRGVKECKGEWIKILGGDDLFLSNAISDVVDYITPDKDIIVSQYQDFCLF